VATRQRHRARSVTTWKVPGVPLCARARLGRRPSGSRAPVRREPVARSSASLVERGIGIPARKRSRKPRPEASPATSVVGKSHWPQPDRSVRTLTLTWRSETAGSASPRGRTPRWPHAYDPQHSRDWYRRRSTGHDTFHADFQFRRASKTPSVSEPSRRGRGRNAVSGDSSLVTEELGIRAGADDGRIDAAVGRAGRRLRLVARQPLGTSERSGPVVRFGQRSVPTSGPMAEASRGLEREARRKRCPGTP